MAKRRKSKRQGKPRGHYCWACDSYRANERFSGAGHAGHLCKDCQKLGSEELKFRQHRRDMLSCLSRGGAILRKHRRKFQEFLVHPDARLREFALDLYHEQYNLNRIDDEELDAMNQFLREESDDPPFEPGLIGDLFDDLPNDLDSRGILRSPRNSRL